MTNAVTNSAVTNGAVTNSVVTNNAVHEQVLRFNFKKWLACRCDGWLV
jgi:hypothetical protein